jgi:hypothetical protein
MKGFCLLIPDLMGGMHMTRAGYLLPNGNRVQRKIPH